MELVNDLTEEQLSWRADELASSVRFHVWHLARWADLVQEIFNGAGTAMGSGPSWRALGVPRG